MNWTMFALGVYGLVGISRFAWAMNRKATWKRNQEAQEVVRNLRGVALVVVILFEIFLWPVELAICFYLLMKDRSDKKPPEIRY